MNFWKILVYTKASENYFLLITDLNVVRLLGPPTVPNYCSQFMT